MKMLGAHHGFGVVRRLDDLRATEVVRTVKQVEAVSRHGFLLSLEEI